jgi:hypothetical protein
MSVVWRRNGHLVTEVVTPIAVAQSVVLPYDFNTLDPDPAGSLVWDSTGLFIGVVTYKLDAKTVLVTRAIVDVPPPNVPPTTTPPTPTPTSPANNQATLAAIKSKLNSATLYADSAKLCVQEAANLLAGLK